MGAFLVICYNVAVMNTKIHRITECAMYLAMIGALMLLDRLFAGIVSTYIPLAISVITIIYTTKYGLKDGLILALCVFILTFILGDILLLIYDFIALSGGIAYGYFAKKGTDKRLLFGIITLDYVIGEFIIMALLMPLFGYDTFAEVAAMVRSLGESLNVALSDDLIRAVYAFSIFTTGLFEAILVHMIAIITLKRLKIKVISSIALDKLRFTSVQAYILFALFALMVLSNYLDLDDGIAFFIYCLGLLAGSALCAQGYIFCLVYGMIVLQRNITIFLVLMCIIFMPLSLVILILFGFLYASGPLGRYLDKKRGIKSE